MKTFVVLGMHRSATSLMAKSLHIEGVHMGEKLILGLKDNPKGHYENRRFVALNDRILKAAGGSWNRPPKEADILKVKNQFKDEIKLLIENESRGHELWGWKDPRTVLTIKLFLPYLINPHFVTVYRDPNEVAKSLTARNSWQHKKGVELAKIYNNRIQRFMNEWLEKKYI